MKNKLVPLLALLPLLVAAQCNPSPQPPAPPAPVIDAGPAPVPAPTPTVAMEAGPPPTPSTPVALACANLRALGCQEGSNGCETQLQHMVDKTITMVNLSCITLAKSKDAARACKPAVACP